ncbi:MAG: DUF2283 domain-containing protein [Gammaproteobacteria bacterium]
MKLQYDQETDSLYIHLSDEPSTDSEEATEGVILDFGSNGALVGIDIQHASTQTDVARMIFEQIPANAA